MLAAFNQEIGRRLASLDKGEYVDAEDFPRKIEAKSRARRKLTA